MSHSSRYTAHRAEPQAKPVSAWSRPQLAARILTLRKALDDLWTQSEMDGGEPYTCIGRMKITLQDLEAELWQRDKALGRAPASPVNAFEPGLPLDVALAVVMQQVGRSA